MNKNSKNSFWMKAMPWLLIVFGFISLALFHAIIAGMLMMVGITMLIERRWPEKWSIGQNETVE